MRVADNKIAELTEDVRIAREERAGAQNKIDNFRNQVSLVFSSSSLDWGNSCRRLGRENHMSEGGLSSSPGLVPESFAVLEVSQCSLS